MTFYFKIIIGQIKGQTVKFIAFQITIKQLTAELKNIHMFSYCDLFQTALLC